MPLLTVATTDHVATLTLNRPESMNALGQAGDGDAFAAACDAINGDSNIRCAILTGAGRAFSAGGDIKAMQNRTGNFAGSPADIADGYRTNIHRILRALYNLRVPLIAAINGSAIGLGGDLACLADMRIASTSAKFGVTFLKLGLVPGDHAGMGSRLPCRRARCADGRSVHAGRKGRCHAARRAASDQDDAAAGARAIL